VAEACAISTHLDLSGFDARHGRSGATSSLASKVEDTNGTELGDLRYQFQRMIEGSHGYKHSSDDCRDLNTLRGNSLSLHRALDSARQSGDQCVQGRASMRLIGPPFEADSFSNNRCLIATTGIRIDQWTQRHRLPGGHRQRSGSTFSR